MSTTDKEYNNIAEAISEAQLRYVIADKIIADFGDAIPKNDLMKLESKTLLEVAEAIGVDTRINLAAGIDPNARPPEIILKKDLEKFLD